MVVAVLNDAAASRDVIAAAQARLIGVFEAIGVSVVWVDMYAGDRSVFVVRIVNEEGPKASRSHQAQSGSLSALRTGMAGSATFFTSESRISQKETVSRSRRYSALPLRTSSGTCSCRMDVIARAG